MTVSNSKRSISSNFSSHLLLSITIDSDVVTNFVCFCWIPSRVILIASFLSAMIFDDTEPLSCINNPSQSSIFICYLSYLYQLGTDDHHIFFLVCVFSQKFKLMHILISRQTISCRYYCSSSWYQKISLSHTGLDMISLPNPTSLYPHRISIFVLLNKTWIEFLEYL